MLNCYICDIEIDNGVRFDRKSCVVFSESDDKVPKIIYKKFEKHSDETVTTIVMKKTDPKEGLVIELK